MDGFEKWLRTVCFQNPTKEAYDLAKAAWAHRSAKWLPIASAPKDGTSILGWCDHEADPYYLEDGKYLTVYGAHTEGLSHVEDGPSVVCWGGAFDDSSYEYQGGSLPDWWFAAGSEFDITANPTHWMPLPEAPKVAA